MSGASQTTNFYIGWDVGGWNCDKNSKSRDAIVILDSELRIVGTPQRGNLRDEINAASNSREWLVSLFKWCEAPPPPVEARVTVGIDTPLGFPESFICLITGVMPAGQMGDSDSNPYLYRQTEHFLFQHGLRPLSAVKDMIGSQATKGMHVLAKFGLQLVRCGVWSDGAGLIAIEAYPSPCEKSGYMQKLSTSFAEWEKADGTIGWREPIDCPDKRDALYCALIAYCFEATPDKIAQPPEGVSSREGWIWVPRDALK